MDGSAAAALANEVTITTTGLLIFVMVFGAIMVSALVVHLRDCSRHRKTFHDVDRDIDKRLTAIETHVKWIRRSLGDKSVDDD